MPKYKIFVVGNDISYLKWLTPLISVTQNLNEADVVMFTGGEDVNPALYNHDTHATTYFSSRDIDEMKMFDIALQLKKKMIGICRGAQFLCIMAGGQLIQDMDHFGIHKIHLKSFDLSKEKIITINSLHHQMQYPYNMSEDKYRILGYTVEEDRSSYHTKFDEKLNKFSIDSLNKLPEPEVVFYTEINALGIQSHPEMMHESFNTDYINLFNDFMLC